MVYVEDASYAMSLEKVKSIHHIGVRANFVTEEVINFGPTEGTIARDE